MKCDQCDQEATVHEVTIKTGKKIEKHLCERCAKKQGIAIQSNLPIQDLINKYVLAQAGASGAKATTCPACALLYSDFRQHGLLGCHECYRVFEPLLAPLLERAHEGGLRHVGKVPRRAGKGEAGAHVAGGPQERAERLLALHRQLEEAVRAEQYEKAARLRDEIKKSSESPQPAIPTPSPKPRRTRKPPEEAAE